MTAASRKQVNALVSDWAQQAFRVIALAHKDLTASEVSKMPSEEDLHKDLVLDCLVAIQDPLRPEVHKNEYTKSEDLLHPIENEEMFCLFNRCLFIQAVLGIP